jgi:predicted ArsR family transcriptional regulator
LTLALIGAMGQALDPLAIERVLDTRAQAQRVAYRARIPADAPVGDKLNALARVRTEEGYMAEVRDAPGGGFLFIEHHCPICAAANACQGLCSTELDLFRAVLGTNIAIERAEHIVAGDPRCVYRITSTLAAE